MNAAEQKQREERCERARVQLHAVLRPLYEHAGWVWNSHVQTQVDDLLDAILDAAEDPQ